MMATDLDSYVGGMQAKHLPTLPKRKRRIFIDGSTSCIPQVEQEESTSAVFMSPMQLRHTRSTLSAMSSVYTDGLNGLNVFPSKTRLSRWTLICREVGKRNVKIDVELKSDSMEITANPLVMETGQNSVGISSLNIVDFFALPLWKLEEWLRMHDSLWTWDAAQHAAITEGRIQLRGLSIATYTKRFPVIGVDGAPQWHLSQAVMALFYGLMSYVTVNAEGVVRVREGGGEYRSHINDAFKSLHVTAKYYTDKNEEITGLRIRQTNAQGIVLFTLSPYDKLKELEHRGEPVTDEMVRLLANRIRLDLKVEAAFLDMHGLFCPADLAAADKLENLLWAIMNDAIKRLGLLYAFDVHGRKAKEADEYAWDLAYYKTDAARVHGIQDADTSIFKRWLNYETVHVKEACRNRIREVTGFDVRFNRDAHNGFAKVINESLIPEEARALMYESMFTKSPAEQRSLRQAAQNLITRHIPVIRQARQMLRGMDFFR